MSKDKREKPKKPQGFKRSEFKPNMRSATAVVSAIAFLQKAGFQATVKNIKKCISQRCRKPVDQIIGTVPSYLSRGLELGILKKHGGIYRLGTFELKARKKKPMKKSNIGSKARKSVECEENAVKTVEESAHEKEGLELGILKKHGGIYRLGTFELKARKKKPMKKSNIGSKARKSVECEENAVKTVEESTHDKEGLELGILKKHGGIHRLGTFELKARKKKPVKKSNIGSKARKSVESEENAVKTVEESAHEKKSVCVF
ncbi:unnamed protein product [Phaedon cochleariae]|uniref:Histone H1 n=1 Tax=Phaedon cochleariae TaxID=80249 RepID=A0A9P0GVJ1_PHACE|nr:unnamed protein product [Phaedon cochleariae]